MDFKSWVKKQMKKPISDEVIAFNFNLYENSDDGYDVQIVGCPTYDSDDPDWACRAIFSSEEDLFHFLSEDWESALTDFQAVLEDYLDSNTDKNALTACKYISFGFV